MKEKIAYFKSPIGTAKIIGGETGIISVTLVDEDISTSQSIPKPLIDCFNQLDEYFKGTRKCFKLNLNPSGTEFQKKIWGELQSIPYGKTSTYKQQSKIHGDLKAIRAVASANGKNPIWIIIPCHRVIGSDGALTGYAGGIWRKKWLLAHESPVRQTSLF